MVAERCFQGLTLECEIRRPSHWMDVGRVLKFQDGSSRTRLFGREDLYSLGRHSCRCALIVILGEPFIECFLLFPAGTSVRHAWRNDHIK